VRRNTDNPEVILGLPEETTSLCPVEDVLTADDLPSHGGHETRWIVHNAASKPVVLSWVNHQGIEVSAADSKTHPPVANAGHWPNGSMLAAGQMAIISGYQGHTFLARELLKDSLGGGAKAGRVLLKHRTGLIFVRNDRGASCPEDIMDDPAPSGEEAKKKIRSVLSVCVRHVRDDDHFFDNDIIERTFVAFLLFSSLVVC